MSDQPLQVIKSEPPSVAHMLEAAINKGVSADDLGKLCDLYERMERISAAKEFAQAFAALQNELPAVQATKAVPNNDGSVRYRFAPYNEIMKQIQPMLTKHGFSVRFSSTTDDQRVTMVCTLMHIGGHSVTNEFSVRVGKGPPGSSESQADGSAASYAQRGALTDALNISIRSDDDARILGAPITAQQAADLERRVMETASDREAFLRFAQAKSFAEISSSKYALLDASLKRKERTN
jgi:hypothetical protein